MIHSFILLVRVSEVSFLGKYTLSSVETKSVKNIEPPFFLFGKMMPFLCISGHLEFSHHSKFKKNVFLKITNFSKKGGSTLFTLLTEVRISK